MPCPYSIILGRDTALPWTLYHSGVTGIDIRPSFGTIFQTSRNEETAMPCPYSIILGSRNEETAMPCSYSIILGSRNEETAMPCPYSGIDVK